MAAPLTAKGTQGVRSNVAAEVPSTWPGKAVLDEVKIRSSPKPISLIGSTSSIGTQTHDIVLENLEKFKIVALAAGSNVTLLAEQIWAFRPSLVSMKDASSVPALRKALAGMDKLLEIMCGEEGIVEVVTML